MYEWLVDALDGNTAVVTASQRLARTLRKEYAARQEQAGRTVWLTPPVYSLHEWLQELAGQTLSTQAFPVRISALHARLLWERCLAREISNPLVNIMTLARQASDAWMRLREWRLSTEACMAAARSEDSRLFARAARRYEAILRREHWVDPAGLCAVVADLAPQGGIALPVRVCLAGFDRITPQVRELLDAVARAGTSISESPALKRATPVYRHAYKDSASEFRAAGAWANSEWRRMPGQRLAIVIPGLEQDAEGIARHVREGFLPGWQYGTPEYKASLNVSYGRRLADYPMIAAALRCLLWLRTDLPSTEIGNLLLSLSLGEATVDVRTRIDIQLRDLPSQTWSPARVARMVRTPSEDGPDLQWRQALLRLHRMRESFPARDAPTGWAERFDKALAALGWPGEASLESREFQVVNRWRDLLNELAALTLVSPTMSLFEAQSRLAAMASESVFQPETDTASLDLLGPLEAAGMEFDKLWVAGLSSAAWPPAPKPSRLIARELQRAHGMPDADPADTLEYAKRILRRLVASAGEVVASHASTDADAAQIPTPLLDEFSPANGSAPPDPGWAAQRLMHSIPVVDSADKVPALGAGELVQGGAGTIQRQIEDPFGAFAHGRLGIRLLPPFTPGLGPALRGRILHDALRGLYEDKPDRNDIEAWDTAERSRRVEAATRLSIRHHSRHADAVVARLLALESRRVTGLLEDVLKVDSLRADFVVDSIEQELYAAIGPLKLRLRVDRIDRVPGGRVILDYKTGSAKRLLDRGGSLRDVQLVVYALAVDGPVEGIALFNVDSRAVAMDGAGAGFREGLNWNEAFADWSRSVMTAAQELSRGDVRLRRANSISATRPLALLSRYRELTRDDR